MSSVGAAPSAPLARPRFKRAATVTVYRWELRKLVSQKRTYLGLGLGIIMPLIFVTVQSLRHHHDAPRGGRHRVGPRPRRRAGDDPEAEDEHGGDARDTRRGQRPWRRAARRDRRRGKWPRAPACVRERTARVRLRAVPLSPVR